MNAALFKSDSFGNAHVFNFIWSLCARRSAGFSNFASFLIPSAASKGMFQKLRCTILHLALHVSCMIKSHYIHYCILLDATIICRIKQDFRVFFNWLESSNFLKLFFGCDEFLFYLLPRLQLTTLIFIDRFTVLNYVFDGGTRIVGPPHLLHVLLS